MANIIQVKRSSADTAASGLAKGEIAWVDHGTGGAAGILYIGDMGSSSTVRKIGGPGWGLELLTSSALTGVPTAATANAGTNTTQLATTAFVTTAVGNATISAISDIGDTTIASLGDAQMLIYDNAASKWKNQSVGGDATMDKTGAITVTGVAANAVALGSDTTGTYVTAISGTANEVDVSSTGTEAKTYTIGLPNNVTIGGTLTVNGGQTEVKSTVVSVIDPVFVVGDSASADAMDRGVEFKHKTGSDAAKVGFFGWDRSANAFTFIPDRTNNSEVMSGTVGNAVFGNVSGTWTGTAISTAKGGTALDTSSSTGVPSISSGTWSVATTLTAAQGGTGLATNGSTGVPSISSGTWSVAANLTVALGGTGKSSVTTKTLLYGNGTGALNELAAPSTAGAFLSHSGGTPAWSVTIDGGTF